MHSPCPPPTRFVITKLWAVAEPHVFVVERFGPSASPSGQITCIGEHELRGFLYGARVDTESINRALKELESRDHAEVEASGE